MNLPLGVRRDGSYYTRIEWASHTESDPTFWVVNLIRDDTERNGGTWGANTMGPATVVLSFFGEEQNVSRIPHFPKRGPGHFDSRGACEDRSTFTIPIPTSRANCAARRTKSIPWIGNS